MCRSLFEIFSLERKLGIFQLALLSWGWGHKNLYKALFATNLKQVERQNETLSQNFFFLERSPSLCLNVWIVWAAYLGQLKNLMYSQITELLCL